MQRKSFADLECGIARAIEEVGDAWTLMILRNALLGARRFQDFERQLAAPATTLTRRLQRLTERGFFVRRVYTTQPAREEYELTQKALDFLPVLLCLAGFGARWLSPGGAPLELVDAQSGTPIEPALIDRRSGRALEAGAIALRPGPGASAALRRALKSQSVVFGRVLDAGSAL